MNIVLASVLVFLIFLLIPIGAYGLFTKLYGLKEPDRKMSFFAGVIVQKLGTTVGFIAFAAMFGGKLDENWIRYGLIWFAMFAITEIGQANMSNYSRKEAAAGIISEAIYFPLAAWVTKLLL